MEESWYEMKMRTDRKFRRYMRWYSFKYWVIEKPWMWLTDSLVWDFNKYPDGRLMHFRTKKFLEENDPRHYEF